MNHYPYYSWHSHTITRIFTLHPQDIHPPSPGWSTTIPIMVNHHPPRKVTYLPKNGHLPSKGRLPTYHRMVTDHPKDGHQPSPERWPPFERRVTIHPQDLKKEEDLKNQDVLKNERDLKIKMTKKLNTASTIKTTSTKKITPQNGYIYHCREQQRLPERNVNDFSPWQL